MCIFHYRHNHFRVFVLLHNQNCPSLRDYNTPAATMPVPIPTNADTPAASQSLNVAAKAPIKTTLPAVTLIMKRCPPRGIAGNDVFYWVCPDHQEHFDDYIISGLQASDIPTAFQCEHIRSGGQCTVYPCYILCYDKENTLPELAGKQSMKVPSEADWRLVPVSKLGTITEWHANLYRVPTALCTVPSSRPTD